MSRTFNNSKQKTKQYRSTDVSDLGGHVRIYVYNGYVYIYTYIYVYKYKMHTSRVHVGRVGDT